MKVIVQSDAGRHAVGRHAKKQACFEKGTGGVVQHRVCQNRHRQEWSLRQGEYMATGRGVRRRKVSEEEEEEEGVRRT